MTDVFKVLVLCGWMDRHQKYIHVDRAGLATARCLRCGADLYKDLMSKKWKAKP